MDNSYGNASLQFDGRRWIPLPRSVKRRIRAVLTPAIAHLKSMAARWDWAHNARLKMRNRHAVFTDAYARHVWGSLESGSGTGSELAATVNLRRQLPDLLTRLSVKSMLDAPCGDWNWMQHVELPVAAYHGVDIVPDVIAGNRRRFSRTGINFAVRNLVSDPLPQVDFILCRDCWVHSSYQDIAAMLENFRRTGATYLLVNSYPEAHRNRNQFTGQPWRPLDLRLPPFNFPQPLESLGDGGPSDTNQMCLWRLQDLPTIDVG